MELTLIQTLKFDLFVSSCGDFVSALLELFRHTTGLHAATPELSLTDRSFAGGACEPRSMEDTRELALEYAKHLDRNFSNIAYLQSAKAVAATGCALAQRSVSHHAAGSSSDEATTMAKWLDSAIEQPTLTSDSAAALGRETVASICGLSPVTDLHVVELQKQILVAISRGGGVFCPIKPAAKTNIPGRQLKSSTGVAMVSAAGLDGVGSDGDMGSSVVRARPHPRRPSLGGTPQNSPIRPAQRDMRPRGAAADASSCPPEDDELASTTAFSAVKPAASVGNSWKCTTHQIISQPAEARPLDGTGLAVERDVPKVMALIKPSAPKATSNTATCSPVDVCDIDSAFPATAIVKEENQDQEVGFAGRAMDTGLREGRGTKTSCTKKRKVAVLLRRSARRCP
jgi:hypothetical protein